MATSITFKFSAKEILEVTRSNQGAVARAVTQSLVETGNAIRDRGIAEQKGAGFSDRFAQGLTFNVYPKDGNSSSRGRGSGPNSSSAALVVRHRVPYADVFEDGAIIDGKPILWLALPTAAQYATRTGGNRITPNTVALTGRRLIKISPPGHPPYLGIYIQVPGKRGRLVQKFVPLFVGKSTVTIAPKFHLRPIIEDEASRIGERFDAALKDVP